MSLYKEWKAIAEKDRTEEEYESYWKIYFGKEKENYQYILENHNEVIEGKLNELAAKFNMDSTTMVGFIDGINSSLTEPIKIDEVEEESNIQLKIDFEKLYFNMLDAKADWLYNLTEWEKVLDEEIRAQITKEFRQSKIAVSSKVGRNEPCPCGSGKKYKKCCGK